MMKPAPKRKPGRPRKWDTPEALQAGIDAYFRACDQAKPPEPYMITGLALALGTNRQTLCRYIDGQYPPSERDGYANTPFLVAPAYRDALKTAKARCEHWTARYLIVGKGHPAGPIFVLKNNFGWVDVQTVETRSMSVVMGVQLSDDARRIIAEQLLASVAPALSPADSPVMHSLTVEREPSSVA